MQISKLICAVLLSVPLCASAQQKNGSPNNSTADKANAKQGATSEVKVNEHVVLKPASKVVTDSAITSPANAKLALASNNSGTAIEKSSNGVKPPKAYAASNPYKHVPMLGDMDYYGKNHKAMLEYTKSYLKNHGDRLARMNAPARGGKYFAIIDKVLMKNKMPLELKYLAVIESALNNNAVSPVGAVGPWQFMEGTARHMGMTVNGNRDDRRDWSRSTAGAAKYMNYLYDIFGDWLLVIASYNSGPRPVMNAISRTGKRDYWAIKQYLPKETQNHVLAFVATATLMERMPNYLASGVPANFKWESLNYRSGDKGPDVGLSTPETPKNPLLIRFGEEELKKMALVRIKSVIDLDILSNALEMDRRLIGRWNYDYFAYMEDFKPGDSYNLRIPKEKLDSYIEKKDFIERQSAKQALQ